MSTKAHLAMAADGALRLVSADGEDGGLLPDWGTGNNGSVSTAMASSFLNGPGALWHGWSSAWPGRVIGVAGPLADLATQVSLGLPGIPGPLQLQGRGSGRTPPGAGGPKLQVRLSPAGRAASRRWSGPGPAGPGRAHRCRRRCGPGSPPPSARSPPAPGRDDRCRGAGKNGVRDPTRLSARALIPAG
jgi:hypothetical protein